MLGTGGADRNMLRPLALLLTVVVGAVTLPSEAAALRNFFGRLDGPGWYDTRESNISHEPCG